MAKKPSLYALKRRRLEARARFLAERKESAIKPFFNPSAYKDNGYRMRTIRH
jgi:hypothetical protein